MNATREPVNLLLHFQKCPHFCRPFEMVSRGQGLDRACVFNWKRSSELESLV